MDWLSKDKVKNNAYAKRCNRHTSIASLAIIVEGGGDFLLFLPCLFKHSLLGLGIKILPGIDRNAEND